MTINKLFSFLILSCIFLSKKGHSEEMHFVNLPKGEFHLHLGGSFPREYLLSIANTDQREELLKALNLVQNGIDYTQTT